MGTEESITQRVLDNNSNLTGLIDPTASPAATTVYDPFNRLVENTHRLDGVTSYTYDGNKIIG